jgi:hypothetical protein
MFAPFKSRRCERLSAAFGDPRRSSAGVMIAVATELRGTPASDP